MKPFIFLIALFTLSACIFKEGSCEDHLPGNAFGECMHSDAKLVVEDHVAICRCKK